MPLELDGPRRRKLREALLDAYMSWAEAAQLTSDHLDLDLGSITSENNDRQAVMFDLIAWAGAHGRLEQLILGAINSNPGNPKLFVFSQDLGLSSTNASNSTLEKVVSGNDTFLDVAKWRAELLRNEWRVCRVDYRGVGVGTGFLVGPDAVITNHHVISGAIHGSQAYKDFSFRFDYKEAINGGTIVRLVDDQDTWLLDSSPHSQYDLEPEPLGHPGPNELDFGLLRLADEIGNKEVAGEERRGWIRMSSDEVDFGSIQSIFILQHPQRSLLKLAIGMDETLEVNASRNRVRYRVPTESGSSGSPVFNADWHLLALHHAGDPDKNEPMYNEGVPVSLIAQREAVQSYLAGLPEEG